ncbi:MAG: 4'-phosphopantetheinyl transferase superfamily protein [Treponema sp.]|nr:4'-phosphopantetheinyl transferase superfamily protein [Treponema sp.]
MKHNELYVQICILSILSSCLGKATGGTSRIPSHKGSLVQQILDDFFQITGIGENYSISQKASGRPFLQLEKKIYKDASADFNISHSKEALAVFVGCSLESASITVGCDLECIQYRASRLEIAQNYFYPQEVSWIFAAQDNERFERFYRIWTAKEAWLKTLGKSIFDISSAPGFSVTPQEAAHPFYFHQFLLTSPSLEGYVLTVAAPFPVPEHSLHLGDGWHLRSSEQIYAAESPMSTVNPKI